MIKIFDTLDHQRIGEIAALRHAKLTVNSIPVSRAHDSVSGSLASRGFDNLTTRYAIKGKHCETRSFRKSSDPSFDLALEYSAVINWKKEKGLTSANCPSGELKVFNVSARRDAEISERIDIPSQFPSPY